MKRRTWLVAVALLAAGASGLSQAPTGTDASAPGLPEGLGLYYRAAKGWQRLSLATAAKHGVKRGFFSEVAGVGSLHLTLEFRGAHASFQTSDKRPEFFLRVADPRTIEGEIVIRFDDKKNRREAEVGSISAVGSKGMKEGRLRALLIKRVTPDVFSLTPETELEPGEYLLRAGTNADSGYDFAVTP